MLRVIGGVALLLLLSLLYWSSQLVEQDVKKTRQEITTLKSQMDRLQILASAPSTKERLNRPYIDLNLPNLLEEDRYYTEVLPKKLGPSFTPSGHLRTAEISKPHNLHPLNNWKPVHDANRRCVGTVGILKAGFIDEYSPGLALKVEQRGCEFWIHLRDDVMWAPLNPDHFPPHIQLASHFLHPHPVTAHDFKFMFDVVMNPHVQEPGGVIAREELQDVETFRIIDDHTFVIRWKEEEGKLKYLSKGHTLSLEPLPRFVYQYFPDGTKIVPEDSDENTYRNHSVFAQNFSQHWASNVIPSCGPYLFDGFNSHQISFKRNPHYHNPYEVLHEKLTIYYKKDGDAIWQAFKACELDYAMSVSFSDKIGELAAFCVSPLYQRQEGQGFGIKRLDYLMRAYHYIGWSQKSLLFKDPIVRHAMTHAIDRQGCIDSLIGCLGEELTGPLMPGDRSYNRSLTPFEYDPLEAQRLLKQAGWADFDGDGILEKEVDGEYKKFSFTLSYPSRSRIARSYTNAIATYLREIGVDCRPFGVEIHDLTLLFDGKEFDAVFGGWALPRAHSPKGLWHSSGASKPGSSNIIAFAHKGIDHLIESLEYEETAEERLKLQHAFHRLIYQEAPYTFLFAPKVAFLHRDCVQNAFIPAERQDLIPGAVMTEPEVKQLYIKP